MSRAERSREARRDWGSDDSQTPILHIDMDAFFVSVELLHHPELVGKPVAVGGIDHGVISAASYEARRFGVNSAMPVGRAKSLCPQLILLPVRMNLYRDVSRTIMSILDDVTPWVEQVSIDEAFLDVSSARKLLGSPVQIARDLRARIRAEAGVPASVGIAATKHVAKIASAHAKPDGLLLIPKDATLDFLRILPVGALWGVGDKTRTKLEDIGIRTIGDISRLGEDRLRRLVGNAHGTHLWELAHGIDPRPVVVERQEKSIGRENTFFDNITDRRELERVLLDQCHDTARRLRTKHLKAGGVGLKVRFADFTTITRSSRLATPSNSGNDLYTAVRTLLNAIDIPDDGIRLLGMRTYALVDEDGPLQLTLDADPRMEAAEHAVDAIRSKFPGTHLQFGSLVERRF